MKKLSKVISVCHGDDIHTWTVASNYITRYIDSNSYVVIVPDVQIDEFIACTNPLFQVRPESEVVGGISVVLDKLMQQSNVRFGWYLQQFIKLGSLIGMDDEEVFLLWDADTIPIKKLDFIVDGKIRYYTSHEFHRPYFDTIKRLCNLDKVNSYSFIAQCFPVYGKHFNALIKDLEAGGNEWHTCIFNAINFAEKNAFSEYELLGTYISKNYNCDITLSKSKWTRHGNGLIGSPCNLRFLSYFLCLLFDYVSFEKWDKPYNLFRLNSLNKIIFLIKKLVN